MPTLKGIRRYIQTERNIMEEILWSNIWHDTIKGISWAENLSSISPGRMAVGYNYLYVMTRILNEFGPQRILDVGLGISSTLISNYFSSSDIKFSERAEHLIIEHDQSWVDFYISKHELSKKSRICIQKLIKKGEKCDKYYAYKNMGKDVRGQKFSVISIDAPFGFMEDRMGKVCSPTHSRRDIIEFIPEILENSFIIIMDDYDEIGEKNTVEEILFKLKHYGINCVKGTYKGYTECCVIASQDNKFFCSL